MPMWGFSGGSVAKESAWQCRRHRRRRFDSWVGKSPWRRAWQPTPVFLPGESHGGGAWWATVHEVTESYMTEATEHACRCLHTKRRHLHISRQKEHSFISWVMDGLSYQEIKILPLPYFNRYWKSGVFHLISYLFHHISNKLWLVY